MWTSGLGMDDSEPSPDGFPFLLKEYLRLLQVLLVYRLLSIEEGNKNREEQISLENDVVMGGTRQDGKL